jgi:hypothetical protein
MCCFLAEEEEDDEEEALWVCHSVNRKELKHENAVRVRNWTNNRRSNMDKVLSALISYFFRVTTVFVIGTKNGGFPLYFLPSQVDPFLMVCVFKKRL